MLITMVQVPASYDLPKLLYCLHCAACKHASYYSTCPDIEMAKAISIRESSPEPLSSRERSATPIPETPMFEWLPFTQHNEQNQWRRPGTHTHTCKHTHM